MRSHREQKREEAATWISAAFEECAERCGAAAETRVPIDTEIQQLGQEFSRVVRCGVEHEGDDDLGQDLYLLKTNGCPGLAIVELILVGTSGFHFTITDALREAGITDEVLSDVKRSLPLTARLIESLNDPARPEPLDFLIRKFSKKLDRRRTRRSIEALPDTLRMLAEMLEKYTDPMIETIADGVFLLSLYLLLHHYRGGFETLGRLLRTMRRVRRTVSPDAKSPTNFRATVIVSGGKKSDSRDAFSKESLEQRLYRFCRDFPSERWNTHLFVTRYTSDAEYRKSGRTLLELVLQNHEQDCKNGPDGYVDRLAKNLKLDDKQRAEMVSIRYEEERRMDEVLAATLPRRIAESPFPAVYFSKDVDSKVREISLKTVAKIRRVLNPEQQVTFDRMEQAAERALERVERKASRSRKQ